MKVLIAVDGTRATRAVLSTYSHLLRQPDEVVLLHVQRLEGESVMIDMLGEPELATLKTSLAGTEHQRKLDDRAAKILEHYRSRLSAPATTVKSVVRAGRPADEILAVAAEEGVELVILGASGRTGSTPDHRERRPGGREPGGRARTPGAPGRGLRGAVQLERRPGRDHRLFLCRGRALSLEIRHSLNGGEKEP